MDDPPRHRQGRRRADPARPGRAGVSLATRCEVYFSSAAARQLRKLEQQQQQQQQQRKRVLHAVRGLSGDPRPPGVKALRGRVGYRIRIGYHRVLYTVDDGVAEAWAVKVGHRRDVYE